MNESQQRFLSRIKFAQSTTVLQNPKSGLGRTLSGGITGLLAIFNPELRKLTEADQGYRDRTSATLGTVYQGELIAVEGNLVYTIDNPGALVDAIIKSDFPVSAPSFSELRVPASADGISHSDIGDYNSPVYVDLTQRRSGQGKPITSVVGDFLESSGPVIVQGMRTLCGGECHFSEADFNSQPKSGYTVITEHMNSFLGSRWGSIKVKCNRTGFEYSIGVDYDKLKPYKTGGTWPRVSTLSEAVRPLCD